MNKKRLLVWGLIIVIFSSLALAAFDPQRGIDFLLDKSQNGGIEGDIVKTGFAALLFNKIGGSREAERAIDFIKTQEDSQGCFPSGNCKIKDTAVAIIALVNLNREIDKNIDFLKNAQSSGLQSSQTLLQVATSGKGNCTASFDINEVTQKRSFLIDQGRFTSCGNVFFLDLNSGCIKGGLASSFPGINLEIDCSDVSSSTVIGTIFKKGNEIFLGESFNSKIARVIINSGCYGVSSKAACNLDSSLFAAWALKEAEADFNIIPFLKQNLDQNSPLHLALLGLITGDENVLKDLKNKQGSNGGFDNSVSTTSFAILSLSQVQFENEIKKAKEFLKGKQGSDGSWSGSTLETALALLALSDEVIVDFGVSGIPSATTCNRDGDCEAELGEDEDTCPQDCFGEPREKLPKREEKIVEVCNFDGNCEKDSGEDEINCPSDCGEKKKEEEKTTEEEKPKSNTLLIILIIIVVLVLLFFVYKKFKGGKKEKKQENKFEFKPFTAQLSKQQPQKSNFGARLFKPVQQKKTAVESELEKSIEEAKKLLKK